MRKEGTWFSSRETNISFSIGVAIQNLNLDKHTHLYEYIHSTHKFIFQMTIDSIMNKAPEPKVFQKGWLKQVGRVCRHGLWE